MDWDDEYDNGYDGMGDSLHRDESVTDMAAGGRLDPMDITEPASAYFLLSDDAQDEISGGDRKKMKCLSCGYMFMGEIYDSCPECFSPDTEEVMMGIGQSG